MNQTLEELNKRELGRCYLAVYFVKNKVMMQNGSRNVYIVYGTNLEGKRQYITSTIDNGDKKTSEWYDLLQGLKKRKLEEVIYAVIPNDKALEEAIKLSLMNTEIIKSMEEDVEKLKKYIPNKKYNELKKILKEIYLSKDEEEYELSLEKFKDTFVVNEFINDMISEKIEKIREYYKMTKEVRTLIFGFHYSSLIYEKLKKQKKRIYEDMNDYLNEKVDNFNTTENQASYTRSGWSEVINSVYLIKKELIKKYM